MLVQTTEDRESSLKNITLVTPSVKPKKYYTTPSRWFLFLISHSHRQNQTVATCNKKSKHDGKYLHQMSSYQLWCKVHVQCTRITAHTRHCIKSMCNAPELRHTPDTVQCTRITAHARHCKVHVQCTRITAHARHLAPPQSLSQEITI